MLRDLQISEEWSKKQAELGDLYFAMIQQGGITLDGKTMFFQWFRFGDRPCNGYSLLFGLHGGGGCPS